MELFRFSVKAMGYVRIPDGKSVDDSRRLDRIVKVIFFIITSTTLSYGVFLLYGLAAINVASEPKGDPVQCRLELVETIPEGLSFPADSPRFMSTFDAWKTLLNISEKSLDIGSYYWTLLGSDVINHTSANLGENIFDDLMKRGAKKLKIRIAQNKPDAKYTQKDTEILALQARAQVRSLDMERLLGGGILHTKLWIADNQHFYLGSANMDWRSLTQVKELGVLGRNCSEMVSDLSKIFSVYWYLGLNTSIIPVRWPNNFATEYNLDNPMTIQFNKMFTMNAIFASSPPPLSPKGRAHDIAAILSTISSAKRFIYISVMDYLPLIIFSKKIQFWPYIDDALKKAAVESNVSIKMLLSLWPHSSPIQDLYLRSLCDLSSPSSGIDIEIKHFQVPATDDQSKIPFARVNHNKYMVTDNTAYIGTSNWSGDYFTDTCGIGLVLKDTDESGGANSTRSQLQSIFERDWNSPYSLKLSGCTYKEERNPQSK